MNESTIILNAIGIEKRFVQGNTSIEVLGGVDLSLAAGERVAIVGRSGSGKSSLLHVLAGLDDVNQGQIFVAGEPMAAASNDSRTALRRKYMGFVYQQHHLLPEFSALENVMIPQMLNGLDKFEAADRAGQLLATVGLQDRVDHRPGLLSGGEQQRVAIARAVANAPRVLLADEPTGNLDPDTAKDVFGHLAAITRATQTAALVVTHNQQLALNMDSILTIENGHVVELA